MKSFLVFLDRIHFVWLGAAAALVLVAFAGCYFWAGFYGQGIVPTYAISSATSPYLDCLYFSVVTFSSLGYGDFRPVGVSRLLASMEVFVGLAFLGIAIAKLSSARQSYYTARLFSSDAQARMDKFSIGFDELRRILGAASGSPGIQEIVTTSNFRCVALLNYIKYETANGPFFDDVPIRAVRRVIRYLSLFLTELLPQEKESQSAIGRKLFRNVTLLATVIERSSSNTFLAKDCAKLRLIIESAKSLPHRTK
jgi:hypothetical protein